MGLFPVLERMDVPGIDPIRSASSDVLVESVIHMAVAVSVAERFITFRMCIRVGIARVVAVYVRRLALTVRPAYAPLGVGNRAARNFAKIIHRG